MGASMKAEKPSKSLAELWIDARFADCDADQNDFFRANVDRALKGEALVDDFEVECRLERVPTSSMYAQWALLLEIQSAVQAGEEPPIPNEDSTPLNALIRLSEPSSFARRFAELVKAHFGAEFALPPCDPGVLEEAARFAFTVQKRILERERAPLNEATRNDIAAPSFLFSLVFYCLNRVDLVYAYFLQTNAAANPARTIAAHWRNAHNLGGIAPLKRV